MPILSRLEQDADVTSRELERANEAVEQVRARQQRRADDLVHAGAIASAHRDGP